MTLDRAQLEAVFAAAVAACDPAHRVRAGLALPDVAAVLGARRRFGVAIGKAALAMAHGLGAVERGVAIVPGGEARELPRGWQRIESAHPFVDERSIAAAHAAREVIAAATPDDVVVVLISGGASALVEEPRDGVTLAELAAITRGVMAAGASIAELNAVRSSLSRVKRGGLVQTCAAPVVTLATSDVVGDALGTIGSGPSIGTWLVDDERERMKLARAVLSRADIAIEPRIARAMATTSEGFASVRDRDLARVVAPMSAFAAAAADAIGVSAHDRPLAGDVVDVATLLGGQPAPLVAWGEPTLRVPASPGEGGRAQQLALHLAHELRGTNRIALVAGSDGIDGPPPRDRPAPAGAIVDGTTWDAIRAAGIQPLHALARCDAGPALAAVGALLVTGPTGINHADLVLIGETT